MNKIKFIKFDAVLAAIFISMSAFILINSYFTGTYISPDSAAYLRAAQGILDGNLLYFNKSAGDSWSWFSVWPGGYPALIALTAKLTFTNVYLASKILSIILLFLILAFFKFRFKENAWLVAIPAAGKYFMTIFAYTWSEQAFILGLMWFSFAIYDVWNGQKQKVFACISLAASGIFIFLCRYAGVFTAAVIFAAFIVSVALSLDRNRGSAGAWARSVSLFMAFLMNSAAIMAYLLMNKIKTGLTTGMARPPAAESLPELVLMFLKAEMKEIIYFTLSPGGIVLLALAMLFFIARKENGKSRPYTVRDADRAPGYFMMLTAAAYLSSVFVMRASTYFDEFNYRIVHPATFIFSAGLINVLVDSNRKKVETFTGKAGKRLAITVILISAVYIAAFSAASVFLYKEVTGGKGYTEMKNETLEKYSKVPPASVVLWMDRKAVFLRKDLIEAFPYSAPYYIPETIEEFRKRIGTRGGIYLDVSEMNKRWEKNPSINIYFEKYRTGSEGLVIITR